MISEVRGRPRHQPCNRTVNSTAKQGLGAAIAAIGSGTILGWIAVTGITGINNEALAATGLGLTLSGGALLTAGRIQEKNELLELQIEIANSIKH